MRKKLYLANPYGFSKQTKSLLQEFIEIFNNLKMNEPYSFSIDQMNGIVEDTYAKIINECENLKKNTNCPNEQVVALLSVIASNYATKKGKNEN